MTSLHANLRFHRPGFTLALEMTLPEHGITALIGPSGCGKTTLLRLLAGLETPSAGSIRLGEEIWFDHARRIARPTRRRGVGVVFQNYALFPHLSVAANIAYGLPRGPQRQQQVRHWLERLQIRDLAERLPATLSGGQRQRVALARALAPRPRVLLLDEPFSAVDTSLRESLRLLLLEVLSNNQVPTLLVTHDLADVRHLADQVGVLVAGELRSCGPTDHVFAHPADAEVARVLGWPNLLPVTHWDGQIAAGAWGTLRLRDRLQQPRPEVLAIRPDGPRFQGSNGLSVRVTRVSRNEGRRIIFCQLPDHTPLRIHLKDNSCCPGPGGMGTLCIPDHCIAPLPARGAPDDSPMADTFAILSRSSC